MSDMERHYNRQKVGSPQFAPTGSCLVLLSDCGRAFWITSAPFAEFVKHAWAGAWVCSAFRNEGAGRASELIRLAVAATRAMLEAAGVPWVIENVPGAPMRGDLSICGCQVGLELRRKRWFETSWRHFSLAHPCHHMGPVVSVVGHGTPTWVRQKLGFNPTIKHYRDAMGIDWMNRDELSLAIPPAYSEFIARAFLATQKEGARNNPRPEISKPNCKPHHRPA